MRQTAGYPLGFVVIDTTGVGHYLALSLGQSGFPVYGFKAGAAPVDTVQFTNAKAEAYFMTEGDVQGGLHQPSAGSVGRRDGSATIHHRVQGTAEMAKVMIEPKEDARKRGVPSPDRAEAEIMAFLRVVPSAAI